MSQELSLTQLRMIRTTACTFRMGMAYSRMLPALPPTSCLSFLCPAVAMSRRSTRLSGGPTAAEPIPIASPSRWASNSASSQVSTSTLPNTTGPIPYFEEWTTEALQAEVKRYGLKVSRKRSTLIDQLKAVYEALQRSKTPFEPPTDATHDATATAQAQVGPEKQARTKRKLILPESTPASAGKGKGQGKGKGRKSDPFVLDDASSESSTSSSSVQLATDPNRTQEEPGDFTVQLELEAASATDGEFSPPPSSVSSSPSSRLPLSASASPRKPRRSRSASSSSVDIPLSTLTAHRHTEAAEEGENEGPAIDPSPALAETMTSAIRSNSSVWARILRYEPISFDEVVSIATQSGLAMDTGKRKELRTWLDRQCICFYVNELTLSRARH